MEANKSRDSYIDILKAIGIISIVLGHCAIWEIAKFTYLYHIMIFFFVAGYCIGEKHISNPEQYVGKSIIKNSTLLIGYNAFFAVFHNIFIEIGILQDRVYGTGDIVRAILNGITLSYSEMFLGAFWFIPVYLVATILFVIILNCIKRITSTNCLIMQRKGIKKLFYIAVLTITTAFALLLNYKSVQLGYHLQTAFLAIPILFVGYFFKKYKEKMNRYISAFGIIPSFLILVGVLKS